jgi:hypothetical protein
MQHGEERARAGGGGGKETWAHARRFCCGSPRNPHPHLNLAIRIPSFLFVYGHVYTMRNDSKERARRALHRKHVRTIRHRPRRGIGGGRHLDQRERVTTICAQRTSRGEVHVVPLGAPTRAADHFCERAASFVGVCAPTVECLRECVRACCGQA